ncbi:DUF2961 domain-containing protein [bacterium]|nr:DUF2961 domain-containing protein [bacterium]
MRTDTCRRAASFAVAALLIGCLATTDTIGGEMERWQAISAVKAAKTHLVPATWTLDKYPDAPTLAPRAKIILLDQDGPGVVTLFHVSDYGRGDDAKLILRVWYDREKKPSIEMPLMDFLGDIQSATKPYSTVYFSHVRKSHNFRLPMPFRRHIKIEVENPTDSNLFGYMDIQWDEVEEVPETSGYLRVDYQSGHFQFPHQDLTLCDVKSPGTIVAHWLQLEGDHPSCAGGQGICEGNHEIYLDGDTKPTCESLGAEDFYGHSWGFGGIESDFYTAIIRHDRTPKGGTRVAMVRARDTDRISFRRSCRILLTYKHDLGEPYNPKTGKGKAPALQPFRDGTSLKAPYRSCVYYYSRD